MQMSLETSSNIFTVLLKKETSRLVSGQSEQENMTYFHFKTNDIDHSGLIYILKFFPASLLCIRTGGCCILTFTGEEKLTQKLCVSNP